MHQNQNTSDTSFDIEIIHHLWVICSNNKVFILPIKELTIHSNNLSALTCQIEKHIGILCSVSDLEKIYEFRKPETIYKGFILNLNFVEELKQFITERTGGKFLSTHELSALLRTDISDEGRDSLLSLLDYLRFR